MNLPNKSYREGKSVDTELEQGPLPQTCIGAPFFHS